MIFSKKKIQAFTHLMTSIRFNHWQPWNKVQGTVRPNCECSPVFGMTHWGGERRKEPTGRTAQLPGRWRAAGRAAGTDERTRTTPGCCPARCAEEDKQQVRLNTDSGNSGAFVGFIILWRNADKIFEGKWCLLNTESTRGILKSVKHLLASEDWSICCC